MSLLNRITGLFKPTYSGDPLRETCQAAVQTAAKTYGCWVDGYDATSAGYPIWQPLTVIPHRDGKSP